MLHSPIQKWSLTFWDFMTFGDENAIIYPLHKYILNTYHLSDRSQALKNQYDGGST